MTKIADHRFHVNWVQECKRSSTTPCYGLMFHCNLQGNESRSICSLSFIIAPFVDDKFHFLDFKVRPAVKLNDKRMLDVFVAAPRCHLKPPSEYQRCRQLSAARTELLERVWIWPLETCWELSYPPPPHPHCGLPWRAAGRKGNEYPTVIPKVEMTDEIGLHVQDALHPVAFKNHRPLHRHLPDGKRDTRLPLCLK